MKWIEALRLWNTEHNAGKWCVPRKGSAEHAQVMALMGKGKVEAKAAPPKVKKMAKKPIAISEGEEIDVMKEFEDEKRMKIRSFLAKMMEKRKAKKTKQPEEDERIKKLTSEQKKLHSMGVPLGYQNAKEFKGSEIKAMMVEVFKKPFEGIDEKKRYLVHISTPPSGKGTVNMKPL